MKYNQEQKNIFDKFENTKDNLVISAVPGSGKTTTIVACSKLIPEGSKSLFIAFNKSIVEELKGKLPDTVDVSTFHSLGCKSIFRECKGKAKTSEYKLFQIAKKIQKNFKKVEPKKAAFYIFNLIKICDLFRLRNETDFSKINEIIDYYDIELIGDEFEDSKKLLKAYNDYNNNWSSEQGDFIIDFVDMIYLPVKNNLYLNQYDLVFIDESQDLNILQHKIIDKVLSKKGRFIAVGDPRQAIYSFAGANSESYSLFAKKSNTIELPLSFCYRCGKNIIEEANLVHNVIRHDENQHEGLVEIEGSFKDIQNGDFILCRNTKPLVKVYFDFLKEEKVCYIKGSDIGKGIINTINNFNAKDKEDLMLKMNNSLYELIQELFLKNVTVPYKHPRYVFLSEKIDIIKLISSRKNTIQEIISTIEKMFGDYKKGIMLSTIHKSKGLETDNVYILNRSLIPSEYASTKEQLEQEANLLFVAITRAKKKLIYVNID